MIDTICAIATAPGQGGVGIVRISGPEAYALGLSICGRSALQPRRAERAYFVADGEAIDDGLILYFPAPHSFTGEAVVELQGHGSPVALNSIISALCALGARVAEPGEFSKRAFLNDRIDLTQAEAIADLISASSERAAQSAIRSLRGEFSSRINHLTKAMIELRVWVEAALDFPEEEIDFLEDKALAQRLAHVESLLDETIAKASQGALLRDGAQVVLVGRPNAGKSSLLNYLADDDIAIVTPIAGTTRDVLRAQINLHGVPLHITDTAGFRDTDDIVELEGLRRARKALAQADLVVILAEINDQSALHSLSQEIDAIAPGIPRLKLVNKIDLLQSNISKKQDLLHDPEVYIDDPEALAISIKSNNGLAQLQDRLSQLVGIDSDASDVFIARTRHLDALSRAKKSFLVAKEQLLVYGAGELMAQDLLEAHNALGEITGKRNADDLLGEIFSSFCIGK